MTETAMPGMGLTPRMLDALDAILMHVASHGVMPSRYSLAMLLGCSRNNANRLMAALIERGEITQATPGGLLTGMGNGAGVTVSLPPEIAARLAAFCTHGSERMAHVVADAIVLHLDHCEGAAE